MNYWVGSISLAAGREQIGARWGVGNIQTFVKQFFSFFFFFALNVVSILSLKNLPAEIYSDLYKCRHLGRKVLLCFMWVVHVYAGLYMGCVKAKNL